VADGRPPDPPWCEKCNRPKVAGKLSSRACGCSRPTEPRGSVAVQSYRVEPGPRAPAAIRERVAAFADGIPLTVECRDRAEERWAIVCGSRVWSRRKGWEHEPLPSSRSEAFLRRARWTLAEACALLDVEAPRG
jgi:hypothetical protein